MANYYAIISHSIEPSKNGGEMVVIIALDLESRDECISYIDPTMRNFDFWIPIITEPNKGHVITNIKRKARMGAGNRYVLNADCEPVVVREFPDIKVMERQLRKEWAKQDFDNTPFGKLFDGA